MAEHPKKLVKIIVEAVEHEWPKEEITYAEVVTLEDPEYPQHPERVY
jgi:transposase